MHQDYTVRELAADATGESHIAFPQVHKHNRVLEVVAVVVEQVGANDADFNVELDGNDLFGTEQNPAATATPEELVPTQNRFSSSDTAELSVDVSTAGTAASTLNISVLTRTKDER